MKFKMYFFVKTNAQLKGKMRAGKVAGQVGHAAARLARMLSKDQWTEYLKFEVKYVYKVEEFPPIKDIGTTFSHLVVDHGLTQIEPDTPTVLGIFTDQDLNANRQFKLY